MFWISLDWDFVTGEHRSTFGRRSEYAASQGWEERLSDVRQFLGKTSLQRIVFADEHHEIFPLLQPGDNVWQIDEHTDSRSCRYPLDCGNWVSWARKNGVRVRDVYNKRLTHLRPHPDASLFIAWSTDWTTAILDEELSRLLRDISKGVRPDAVGESAAEFLGRSL